MINRRDAAAAFIKNRYPSHTITGFSFATVNHAVTLMGADITDGKKSRVVSLVVTQFIAPNGKTYWNVRQETSALSNQLLLASLKRVKSDIEQDTREEVEQEVKDAANADASNNDEPSPY